MQLRKSLLFQGVVWLMVGLTVHVGFAQVGPPIGQAAPPAPVASTAPDSSSLLPASGGDADDVPVALPPPADPAVRGGGGGGADWLTATAEADHADRLIQAKLAGMGPGVSNAFHFVRDHIGYEAYEGSLRGARGTLWSGAGNSLDQASLLIALLRGQGIGARYAQGTLSTNDARVLIRSMFDPVVAANAVGYIPERFPIYEPETDPGLLRWSADHWWVELEDGTSLDPCFADAAVGQARGTPSATFYEVPDELRHKVVVRLQAEFHNPLSQYTYQTPLEVTFSTPEVYGRALTLGHFVGVYQAPALVTGWRTYTYSPYLMVDDNDADWGNNPLIRGTDYQEFFTSFLPLANSTLTRLTLEFEVRDPGKAPDIRTRDILDRVGFAARHGLAPPNAVDPSQPAITEYDVATVNILPGWYHPPAIVPQGQSLTNLQAGAAALEAAVTAIAAKDPASITATETATVQEYSRLLRALQAVNAQFLNAAFLIDADHWIRLNEPRYLVRAWFDSPRLVLTQMRIHNGAGGGETRGALSLDIRKDDMAVFPYPGQNSRVRFSFNMARGLDVSLVEHLLFERLVNSTPNVRASKPSAVAVFRAAKEQGIPIRVLQGTADIQRLEELTITPEAQARITASLQANQAVNVPSRMVDLNGQPAIAWYELDAVTGQLYAAAEDGGRQEMIEFALISGLILTASVLTLTLFGNRITQFFQPTEVNQTMANPSFAFSGEQSYRDSGLEMMPDAGLSATFVLHNDGSADITLPQGESIQLSADVMDLTGHTTQATDGNGSVVRWLGLRKEITHWLNPGSTPFDGVVAAGADFAVETIVELAIAVAHGENSIPSSYRLAIANAGLPDPGDLSGYRNRTNESFLFQVTGTTTNHIWGTDMYTDTSPLATAAVHAGVLTNGQTGTVKVTVLPSQGAYPGSYRNGVNSITYSAWNTGSYRFETLHSVTDASHFHLSGQAPSGWNLLFARTDVTIPPGVSGEVSAFLQLAETNMLPSPGAAVDFTLVVSGGRGDPTAVVTQPVHFVMPEIHDLKVTGTPEIVSSSPDGTNAVELVLLNTGNVDETITLTLPPPAGFNLSGLASPVTLGPGSAVTQTVAFAAQNVAVDTAHSTTLLAQFGPTNGLTKKLEFQIQVAVPGALEALRAANDARACGHEALAGTLDALGKAISQLYGAPTNAARRSRVLANLGALAGGLDDPLLKPFAPGLLVSRDQLAAAADDQVTAALETLGVQMRGFTQFLQVLARHDFELALQPNAADAQPLTATSFGLCLKNKGTQTTTYRMDLSGVPAGITGGLTRTNIILRPGQVTSPTLSGADHVAVVLSQPTNQLTAFDFTVTVTAEAAPQVTREAVGSFTAREELVRVLEVRTDPAFVEPQWERTEIGTFTGGDPGEGLDLDGTFLYAVNVGGNAVGRIRDAAFTDSNVPGVTLTAVWGAAHNREFGDADTDNRLEQVVHSDRYGDPANPVIARLANLIPGRPYKLQLLFAEDWTLRRGFDVLVDGAVSANDLNLGGVQGGVSVTNRAVVVTHEFLAESATVNIELNGSHVAGYANRDPLLCGFTLEALPQKWVGVSTRVLNAVNVDRPVLAGFSVKNAAGDAVFRSTPQPFNLSVLAGVEDWSLGGFDPTAFRPGVYRIQVEITESDGRPLAGGRGTGSFLLGSPVAAELTCVSSNLPPGNSVAGVTLKVASQMDFGTNGIRRVGLHDTAGTAQFLALAQGMAYVGGTENGDMIDVSNPWNPQWAGALATNEIATAMWGERLLHRQGFGLDVLDLNDPEQPAVIGHCGAGFSGSTFPTHFFTHGDFALANALIFGYGSTAVNFARGDLVSYDLRDPTKPVPLGLLFDTPHAVFTNYVGSDYFIGQAAAKDGIVLLPSTTGKDAATGGTGRLVFADARSPGQVTPDGEFLVEGTRVLTAVAVSGNRALVLGNTGGFTVSSGAPVLAGEVTANVLDVTDPLHPWVMGATRTLPGVDLAVRWQLHAFPGPEGLFFVSHVIQDGKPALWVLDTSDPNRMETLAVEVPGPVQFAEFKEGLLYTAGGSGIALYDLGGLLGVPVVARVEVPKEANTGVVSGSFDVAPDEVISGSASETLVWRFNLSRELREREFHWQVGVTNLGAGESRVAALGGEVQFTAWGRASSVALAALRVTGRKLLHLEPVVQSVRPGQAASYTVVVTNPTPAVLPLDLALHGLPTEWKQMASAVSVMPGSSTNVTVVLTPDTGAALGDRSFRIEAASGGEPLDAAGGLLSVVGQPPAVTVAHGLVVSLDPVSAAAGPGTAAHVTVRVTNTGNVTEQCDLAVQLPEGISPGGPLSLDVPPGLENYREAELVLRPERGLAPGPKSYTVTAVSVGAQATAEGRLDVLPVGLDLGISPERGGWDTTYTVQVANPNATSQTYDLTLAGPLMPVARLSRSNVTVAAHGTTTVAVTLVRSGVAYPGELPLQVGATAREDPRVEGFVTATVEVPVNTGVEAWFAPSQVGVPIPGEVTALFVLHNTGNTEDTFTARVAGVSGPVTANLLGPTNQPVPQTGTLRLPGLTSGAVLLQAKVSHPGTGTVQVVVSSLEHSNVTAEATLQVGCGVWLGMKDEWIIEVSFLPEPGVDYFLEYRDGVSPEHAWEELPGGPFNGGLYYICFPEDCERFNLTLPDPQGLFVDCGDQPVRYYRLRASGGAVPQLHARGVRVSMLEFTPLPGFDHTLEYADDLAESESWHDLPRGPHNAGLAFDPRTQRQRFYRVRTQAHEDDAPPMPGNHGADTYLNSPGRQTTRFPAQ